MWEREGGLLAYPSWASSVGRWEGRRAGRRCWTQCPLAASGAFRSPPLTETGSSSGTEGSWCLWTCVRRRAELARGTEPFPEGEDARVSGFFFFLLFVRQPVGGSTAVNNTGKACSAIVCK